jgi:hypothetical protein
MAETTNTGAPSPSVSDPTATEGRDNASQVLYDRRIPLILPFS